MLAGWIGHVVNAWVTERRERRQYLHRAESERLLRLEERAGKATALVLSMPNGKYPDPELSEELKELMLDGGRFSRHRELSIYIRDLHNEAMWLAGEKRRYRDTRSAVTDLHDAFARLLEELKVLRGN